MEYDQESETGSQDQQTVTRSHDPARPLPDLNVPKQQTGSLKSSSSSASYMEVTHMQREQRIDDRSPRLRNDDRPNLQKSSRRMRWLALMVVLLCVSTVTVSITVPLRLLTREQEQEESNVKDPEREVQQPGSSKNVFRIHCRHCRIITGQLSGKQNDIKTKVVSPTSPSQTRTSKHETDTGHIFTASQIPSASVSDIGTNHPSKMTTSLITETTVKPAYSATKHVNVLLKIIHPITEIHSRSLDNIFTKTTFLEAKSASFARSTSLKMVYPSRQTYSSPSDGMKQSSSPGCYRKCHSCNSGSSKCPANGKMAGTDQGQVTDCPCGTPCFSSATYGNCTVARGCGSGFIYGLTPCKGHSTGASCFCFGDRCNNHNMTAFLEYNKHCPVITLAG